MLFCMIETCKTCYVLYFEARNAKQYGFVSKMFPFLDICHQVMKSRND